MKIELRNIKVSELVEGYQDDHERKAFAATAGNLNMRPLVES